jgi:predicted ArsR family transcriptional regulator
MAIAPRSTKNVRDGSSSDASGDELRAVLSNDINGEEQLRVLLFLSANREQDWTADELGDALGVSTSLAGTTLEDLRQQGLVALHYTHPARYSYTAQYPQLDHVLGQMFSSDGGVIATTAQMNTHSFERMRAAAAKAFGAVFAKTRTRIRRPPQNE